MSPSIQQPSLPVTPPSAAAPLPEEVAVQMDDGSVYMIPADLIPNIDELVTEDGAPVDNIFTEKQQTLLKDSLAASWAGPGEGRCHQAFTNVAFFHRTRARRACKGGPGLAPRARDPLPRRGNDIPATDFLIGVALPRWPVSLHDEIGQPDWP